MKKLTNFVMKIDPRLTVFTISTTFFGFVVFNIMIPELAGLDWEAGRPVSLVGFGFLLIINAAYIITTKYMESDDHPDTKL